MYIVIDKFKDYSLADNYSMRFTCFEQMEDAIIWAVTANMRHDIPLSDFNDVYESNVYEIGEKIL